jgi:hypothetical protein
MQWKGLLSNRKGQNTVEYMLMLTVVVGVVLISGMAMKRFMPGFFERIQAMIMNVVNQMGS